MKYLVRPSALAPYSPANHTGTSNLRLIGPETGARQVEVVLGDVEQGRGALPHVFQATSKRARVLVIYAPPYLEKPENVRRGA